MVFKEILSRLRRTKQEEIPLSKPEKFKIVGGGGEDDIRLPGEEEGAEQFGVDMLEDEDPAAMSFILPPKRTYPVLKMGPRKPGVKNE